MVGYFKKLFDGRASWKDFWLGMVIVIAFYFLLGFLGSGIREILPKSNYIDAAIILPFFFVTLYLMLVFVSLIVRRLHDTGKTGFYAFAVALPFIGYLVLIYFLLLPGSKEKNKHGNKPAGFSVKNIFKLGS